MAEEGKATEKGAQPTEGSAAVEISKPVGTPPEQPATEKHLDKFEREMNAFERSTLRWTKATFFILGITGLFISLQWCEMRSGGVDTHDLVKANQDTLAINREALQSVQRAFVTFSTSINFYGNMNPQTKKIVTWEFSVPIQNSGTTPTRGMRMRVRVYPSDTPIRDDFDFPDGDGPSPQNIVIGPRQTTWTDQVGDVSPEIISGVQKNRSKHLYIYGWATYRDVFDKTPLHVTKFCYELTHFAPDPFTGTGPANTFYSACPHHNCIDEECQQEIPKTPPDTN